MEKKEAGKSNEKRGRFKKEILEKNIKPDTETHKGDLSELKINTPCGLVCDSDDTGTPNSLGTHEENVDLHIQCENALQAVSFISK